MTSCHSALSSAFVPSSTSKPSGARRSVASRSRGLSSPRISSLIRLKIATGSTLLADSAAAGAGAGADAGADFGADFFDAIAFDAVLDAGGGAGAAGRDAGGVAGAAGGAAGGLTASTRAGKGTGTADEDVAAGWRARHIRTPVTGM